MHTLITRKVTLRDRLSAAYHAFHMRYTPDVAQMMQKFEEQRAVEDAEIEVLATKRNKAIEKLPPFDIAMIDSVHSMTENWRGLFDAAFMSIEKLSVEDQITIMQYVFSGNRHVVTELRFKQWMTRNAEAILNSIPE